MESDRVKISAPPLPGRWTYLVSLSFSVLIVKWKLLQGLNMIHAMLGTYSTFDRQWLLSQWSHRGPSTEGRIKASTAKIFSNHRLSIHSFDSLFICLMEAGGQVGYNQVFTEGCVHSWVLEKSSYFENINNSRILTWNNFSEFDQQSFLIEGERTGRC